MRVGAHGPARDAWPAGIGIVKAVAPHVRVPEPLPSTVEGIGERCVIEPLRYFNSDATRRKAIFLRDGYRENVSARFYGFIKTVNIQACGDWNG